MVKQVVEKRVVVNLVEDCMVLFAFFLLALNAILNIMNCSEF